MSPGKLFHCPNCSASLDPGDGPTVRCPYCNSTVIVPESIRPSSPSGQFSATDISALSTQARQIREIGQLIRRNRKIEAIKLYRETFGVGLKEAKDAVELLAAGKPVAIGAASDQTQVSVTSHTTQNQGVRGCVWFLIVLAALGVAAVIAFSLIGGSLIHTITESVDELIQPPAQATMALPGEIAEELTRVFSEVSLAATTVPTPGFASLALSFGGTGTGPGYLDDSRAIGVDGQGNIYVGDYSNGRIQRFDPDGNFLSLFTFEAATPVVGMDVDRAGVVYVVQGGFITRYDGATGEQLGRVEYGDRGFNAVAVTADGGLVAAGFFPPDRLVRFDNQGNVVFTLNEAISGQTSSGELNMKVAVDGLGNIYVLGAFHDAVFKYTPDGRYLNRFGGAGREPGQFTAPGSIAVDAQGRVYVSDFQGIQVFDGDGRYLDLIDVPGVPSGMVFNARNELLVTNREQVFKYVLEGR